MTQAVLALDGLEFSRPPAGEGFRLTLAPLTIHRGEIVALAGESGSGKSTLLDILGLILAPERIARFVLTRRDGAEIDIAARLGDAGDPLAEIRRDAIGYVLQQGGLLPFLTVRQNLELTRRPDRPPPMPLEALAARLGIGALLDRKPDHISIGQRQRVAIGRALMGDPELILADEPTSSLDPPTARRTVDLLIEMARERGVAVIMASHSWALVEDLGLPQIRPVLSDRDGRVTADFARAAA